MCVNRLDDIVRGYSNTYHSTMKKMPVDVNSSTYDSRHMCRGHM